MVEARAVLKVLGSTLLLGAALVASGCSGGDPVNQGSDEIVGGVPTSGFPSVGYLRLAYKRADGARAVTTGPECTGTLIAPRVVLTAAHCVNASATADSGEWSFDHVLFGTLAFGSSPETPVTRMVLNPAYVDTSPPQGEHDMAYLVLATPVAGVEPATIFRTSHPADCNFVSMGYGQNADAANSPQERMALNACADDGLDSGGTIATHSRDNVGSICFGDSGSPLRIRLQNALVGVASYIAAPATPGAAAPSCGPATTGHYAPVTSNLDFIDEALAAGN